MRQANEWKRILPERISALRYADPRREEERYASLMEQFCARFGSEKEFALFSAPGRTEIGGNHTDHQHGRVLAAAVTLDTIAAAAPNSDGRIRVYSEGHVPCELSLDSLEARSGETGKAVSLVRGVAARLAAMGYPVGGFDACTVSDIPKGSGLSSSAAFEVLIGTILCGLYGGNLSAPKLAEVGQYAENVYFGKPSGLMDQMACACGGMIAVDFAQPGRPLVEKIPCEIAAQGYALCIVNTGGSHADLTAEYAAVPEEMRAVARCFGKEVLREVSPARFYAELPVLRKQVSDRAVLRAAHFFEENERVLQQEQALRAGDFSRFLELVRASGESSLLQLQNIYPAAEDSRAVALGLSCARRILAGTGAVRVHGGGFAGTIQAYVPLDLLDRFCRETETVFGAGSCRKLEIRPHGGVML
jgi:galactokinase